MVFSVICLRLSSNCQGFQKWKLPCQRTAYELPHAGEPSDPSIDQFIETGKRSYYQRTEEPTLSRAVTRDSHLPSMLLPFLGD